MRKWMVLLMGSLLLAVLGLVACAGGGSTLSPDGQKAVDLAKAALATKLGVEQSKVSLFRVEAVDWPDTSLGVPEPGKLYAQVITPGFRVVLSHGGTEYEYHAGKLGGQMAVVFAK
ncbi:MAG: hypothetical protein AB1603_02080 [Chloroflexota bacterium]